MKYILILGALVVHICYAVVNHEHEQIWRVFAAANNPDIETFIDEFSLDVWSSRTDHLDIRVTPEIASVADKKLNELGMSYDVMIDDIQRIIDNQMSIRRGRQENQQADNIDVNQYHNLDEIYAYLDELEESFDFVTVETIGQSIEGRDMKVVKLSTQVNNPNAMWVQCGIHAREWVSPASCIYGLQNFTSEYGLDSRVTSFLDSQDLYMVVVANPDGYSYSWIEDRLWRKNRRANVGMNCFGVDLNRNYDDGVSWGRKGASCRPCLETYHGTRGFSEPELVAIRNKVISIKESQNIKSFYDVHAYSNLWLYAYAFTPEEPEFVHDLNNTAAAATTAMESLYGTMIVYGPHYSTIYQASGTSVDWAYRNGIIHSYILELRDNGEYGFLLPEDQIVPTATECWTGILTANSEI